MLMVLFSSMPHLPVNLQPILSGHLFFMLKPVPDTYLLINVLL